MGVVIINLIFALVGFFSSLQKTNGLVFPAKVPKHHVDQEMGYRSRRRLLEQIITTIPLAGLLTFSSALPANAMYENAPVTESSPVPLPSGVTYQDLRSGEDGSIIVEKGKRVNIQWVLKRSNGYFVDSSSNSDGVPFIFVVGGNKDSSEGGSRAIEGLDEGIQGMRLGGIRRIVIPPSLAYVEGVEDNKPGPVPRGFGPKQRIRRVMELLKDIPGESIVLDVKVTRIQ
eukprot:CAMPEP_0172318266 /NCGR_PEP_ID=MMETSP1058-20130122/34369_1 /TAXON_ID=83371 /ORGANISM="Detonula confervacea, Strain CCMP 353" /LENGTH=228 /DNA_ID=CAMNT_0013033053 /DNA_START=51 /DNA_END=737 /DNA_ORIENTATION=+